MEISRAGVVTAASDLTIAGYVIFRCGSHRCKNSCKGPEDRLNYQVTTDVFSVQSAISFEDPPH